MSTFRYVEDGEKPIETDENTADGVFVKQVVVPKADTVIPQHSHLWDHSTLLTNGAVYLWRDGVLDRQYRAPCIIHIPKGVKHRFLTLRDNTVFYCVHNLHAESVVKVLEEHNLTPEDL